MNFSHVIPIQEGSKISGRDTMTRRLTRESVERPSPSHRLYTQNACPFETLDTGLFAGMTASYSIIATGFFAGDDPVYGAMIIPICLATLIPES